MKDSVRDAFLAFTKPLEGVISFLYQDVKGLVSIGIGNLVDPIQLAMTLPLVRTSDGQPATRNEIAAEWAKIKALPDGAAGGWRAAARVVTLHLTDDGINDMVLNKLAENDRYIAARFPQYESWPADAQLGVMSMCWAVGPAFQADWPRFTASLREQDWRTAAVECFMPEAATISGLRPRNKADELLFSNAAEVVARQLDPDRLYWPRDLSAPLGPEDETLPGATIHPIVPLDHPALDDDDEPPPAAA